MEVFEKDGFSVEAQKESGCRLSLKIGVCSDFVKRAYKRAVKKINKQISIPGFRKGKAPDATIIHQYGSYVDQEWKEILLNEAYRRALDLTAIFPMNKESIQRPKIESCSQEEGAVVLLAYEHYPNVPKIDFTTLNLPTFAKEAVTEEQVDGVISRILRQNAEWEKVEGRGVQKGDFVEVSIDQIDVDPPKSILKNHRLEVDDQQLAPWILKLLIGMDSSNAIEGMSEVDPQADDETKKAFKPIAIRLTLHEIKTIILPELSDQLAKKLGAASIEEMKGKISLSLEKENEVRHRQKQIEALESVLLEKYVFDLPASLVEEERVSRIRSQIEFLKKQGKEDEEIKGKEEEIESTVAKEVEVAIRLYFLIQQIIKQENISLSNQELNEALASQMMQNPIDNQQGITKEKSREMVNRLASRLIQRKAKEYVLEQIKDKQ